MHHIISLKMKTPKLPMALTAFPDVHRGPFVSCSSLSLYLSLLTPSLPSMSACFLFLRGNKLFPASGPLHLPPGMVSSKNITQWVPSHDSDFRESHPHSLLTSHLTSALACPLDSEQVPLEHKPDQVTRVLGTAACPLPRGAGFLPVALPALPSSPHCAPATLMSLLTLWNTLCPFCPSAWTSAAQLATQLFSLPHPQIRALLRVPASEDTCSLATV